MECDSTYLMINVPVYYVKEYKTKDNKTFLVNLNFARTAHYYLQNEVKQWYSNFIMTKLLKTDFKIKNEYEVALVYYYKNTLSDLDNVCSQILKYSLDAFEKAGVIINDNIKYGKKVTYYVGTCDKENPRVEVYIKHYEDKEKYGCRL